MENIDIMEQWEKDLREKLMKELPEGFYQFPNIGRSGFVGGTGKLGWIDFEVAIRKQVKEEVRRNDEAEYYSWGFG